MYELMTVVLVLAFVALVVGYAKLKQASYGRSRCAYCHKALKRGLGGRASVCHHCGRPQPGTA